MEAFSTCSRACVNSEVAIKRSESLKGLIRAYFQREEIDEDSINNFVLTEDPNDVSIKNSSSKNVLQLIIIILLHRDFYRKR